MKVLLDENLSPVLRRHLPGHEVVTTVYAGWAALRNGSLLTVAEESGFEVFLTGDQNVPDQQSFKGRKIAVVVLSAHAWEIIRHHLPAIAAAVNAATPGTITFVQCGDFDRSSKR